MKGILVLCSLLFSFPEALCSPSASSSAPLSSPGGGMIGPLVIPVVKSKGVYGYLRLEILLAPHPFLNPSKGEALSSDPLLLWDQLLPKITDLYLTSLYGLLGDRWLPEDPLTDVVILPVLQALTLQMSQDLYQRDCLAVYLKNFTFVPSASPPGSLKTLS